ncbi:serine protease Do [Lachnospiraceae bacterium]|nr:serine protease Do [Lachnospiraceae bacterium]
MNEEQNKNEYGEYTDSSVSTDSGNESEITGSAEKVNTTSEIPNASYSGQNTGFSSTGYNSQRNAYNGASYNGASYNNPQGAGYNRQNMNAGMSGSYGNTYNNGYPNVGSTGTNSANRYNDYRFSGNGNSHIPNNPINSGAGRPPKKKGAFWKKALGAVALGLIFGAFAGTGLYVTNLITGMGSSKTEIQQTVPEESGKSAAVAGTTSANTVDGKVTATATTTSVATTGATDVSSVAETVMPAVVAITNEYTSVVQDFWGQQYSKPEQSAGSGIIVGDNGEELLIVTNEHVVSDADSLGVQFVDGTTVEANIKGEDESNDIAVIAVEKSSLSSDTISAIKIATLGDSDKLKVGQQVVAIGNALGYGQSVTTGIVSALNREFTLDNGTHKLIQTDAAINPGNSGGALLDMNGNLIGINEAKLASAQIEGMGYAIPISTAKPIIEQLMNQNTKIKVSDEDRGYLGIGGYNVTSEISEQYNMPRGVYVAKIYKGTGAEIAGLEEKDIITSFDGQTVQTMEQLQNLLEYYKAGDKVEVVVQKPNGDSFGYTEKKYTVTLTDAKGSNGGSSSSEEQKTEEQDNSQQQEQNGYGNIKDFNDFFNGLW